MTLFTVEAFKAGREMLLLVLRETLPLDEVGFVNGEVSLSRELCCEMLGKMGLPELLLVLLSETPVLELCPEELREMVFLKERVDRLLLSDKREAGLEFFGGCGVKLTE